MLRRRISGDPAARVTVNRRQFGVVGPCHARLIPALRHGAARLLPIDRLAESGQAVRDSFLLEQHLGLKQHRLAVVWVDRQQLVDRSGCRRILFRRPETLGRKLVDLGRLRRRRTIGGDHVGRCDEPGGVVGVDCRLKLQRADCVTVVLRFGDRLGGRKEAGDRSAVLCLDRRLQVDDRLLRLGGKLELLAGGRRLFARFGHGNGLRRCDGCAVLRGSRNRHEGHRCRREGGCEFQAGHDGSLLISLPIVLDPSRAP